MKESFSSLHDPLLDPSTANATPEQLAAYKLWLLNRRKSLNACKMEEGQSVSSHVVKMKSFIDWLECLGHPMPYVLAVNTILGSIPKSFNTFVMNYNMQGWDMTLKELHSMLKLPGRMCLPRVLLKVCI
ncbi:zinc finger, CCHC-type [Artemisia annua]|uniref:Zinc finger, CCHC-type n=1 Tax=Artemisia annua TaxID=35608 RepID=A0A2U1LSY0_ARTAN|nr:zinc finger, CCHC-type [Artemisia annua]